VTPSVAAPATDARILGDVACDAGGALASAPLASTTFVGHLMPGESTHGSGQAFGLDRLRVRPDRCELRLFLAHGGPAGPRLALPPACLRADAVTPGACSPPLPVAP
jgi:hypothetical protein